MSCRSDTVAHAGPGCSSLPARACACRCARWLSRSAPECPRAAMNDAGSCSPTAASRRSTSGTTRRGRTSTSRSRAARAAASNGASSSARGRMLHPGEGDRREPATQSDWCPGWGDKPITLLLIGAAFGYAFERDAVPCRRGTAPVSHPSGSVTRRPSPRAAYASSPSAHHRSTPTPSAASRIAHASCTAS